MVARQQYLGHPFVLVQLRPRVVRTVQQAVGEGVFLRRAGGVQRARQLAHDRVEQHHRRQFPARQHEVAERELFIDLAVDQALIHAFVAAAQQHQARFGRKFHHHRLIQPAPLGRQVDHPAAEPVRRLLRGARGRDRLHQRLGQHHHAGPAPVGPVIHRAMRIAGEVARVVETERVQPAFDRPTRDAAAGQRREHLREQRDHVVATRSSADHRGSPVLHAAFGCLRMHRPSTVPCHQSFCQLTRMRRAGRSTSST